MLPLLSLDDLSAQNERGSGPVSIFRRDSSRGARGRARAPGGILVEMKFLFVLVSVFTVLLAPRGSFAINWESKEVCTNLDRYVCREAIVFDGTGTSRSDETQREFAERVLETYRKSARQPFLKTLSENADFRARTIRALGADRRTDCQRAEPSARRSCDAWLADNLAGEAARDLFPESRLMIVDYPLPTHLGYAEWNFLQRWFGTDPRAEELDLMELEALVKRPEFQKVKTLVRSDLDGSLGLAREKKRIEKVLLPQIQRILIAKTDALVADPVRRDAIRKRIEQIQLKTTDKCRLNGLGAIDDFNKANAYYDPKIHAFTICDANLLMSDSDFEMVQIITHEVAHSFGPCFLGCTVGHAGGQKQNGIPYSDSNNREKVEREYPFAKVMQCLREPKATGGQTQDRESNAKHCRPSFCRRDDDAEGYGPYDTAEESMADWWSAEVLAEFQFDYTVPQNPMTTTRFRKGMSNVMRSVFAGEKCDRHPRPNDEHLPSRVRIRDLILAQPRIRGRMGCEGIAAPAAYCPSTLVNAATPASEEATR